MMSLLYIIFAVLGLGFLVFIHELGHYFVARRKGMRVEAFSIGFGKPLISWTRDGVQWQIGMLPFGGFVKIAGMQKEGDVEPSDIPDGFYGKKPWARIQVALAGPLVNIGFALIVFTSIWFLGGRDKPFTEYTHRIGWVDPKSTLYAKGVRPGDVIEKYDGRSFHGFKDLLISSMMKGDQLQIEGTKLDYLTGAEKPYQYTLKTYESPNQMGKDKLSTIGVLSPARYLIFQGEIMKGSPMEHSGIQPNDRLIWADGQVLFSAQQLSSLVNEQSAFVTIRRNGKIIQTKVPRVKLSELALSSFEKGEIDDWLHEAKLKKKLSDLYFIPYSVSPSLTVEKAIPFIDEADEKKALLGCETCRNTLSLQEGDQILALDGQKVSSNESMLVHLQTPHSMVIVERSPKYQEKVLFSKADEQFASFSKQDLQKMVSSIGTNHPITHLGDLYLLPTITPQSIMNFPFSEEQKAKIQEELAQTQKQIDAIQDPSLQEEALSQFQASQKKLVLGLPLVDREVLYNPTPQAQFVEVFQDTYRTLTSLFSGAASPKYLAGPVGIIQVVHHSWTIGVKEALFWMALISLNLGIVNLLPLPVLDGGHIVFSCVEMVTKKPIKAKTMERLIIPFVVLLIGFFIFVTYHDLARIFSRLFS